MCADLLLQQIHFKSDTEMCMVSDFSISETGGPQHYVVPLHLHFPVCISTNCCCLGVFFVL